MNKRDFRHAISVLKKQGLISAKIDARKAVVSSKDRGKRLDTLVRKYDDVISGKIQAVKIPKSQLTALRKQGFETAAGRVLVPKTKSEVAKFVRGEIVVEAVKGQQRVIIPVEFHNIDQYLKDLRKNAALIDRMKRNNEYFGIRFRGGQRANFYSSINQLIEDLNKYSFVGATLNRTKQEEIFQNLEIMRISPSGALQVEREVQTRRKPMSAKYNRLRAKKQYAKTKRIPNRAARRRAYQQQWMKDYRASLKGKAKTEYLKAARTRYRRAKRKKAAKKAKRKK